MENGENKEENLLNSVRITPSPDGSASEIISRDEPAHTSVESDGKKQEKDVTGIGASEENDNNNLHNSADDSDLEVRVEADEREFVFLGDVDNAFSEGDLHTGFGRAGTDDLMNDGYHLRREQACSLMNERMLLSEELSSVRYRLRRERMSLSARLELRRSLRLLRLRLRENAVLLERYSDGAFAEAKRYRALRFSIAMGVLGLVMMVGTGVVLFCLREPIWELIKSLYYKIVGYIPAPDVKIDFGSMGFIK